MTDSVLYEACAALTAWEQQHFRRSLQASATGRRLESALLFDYLCACRRGGVEPTEAAAGQAVFGVGAGNAATLRHIMSELLGLLREFIIARELAADPGRRELYWLQAVRKRGLKRNFPRAQRDLQQAVDGLGEADISRYLLDFSATMQRYDWEIQTQRDRIFPAETLITALNNWYAGQLLQLTCMADAQAAVRRQEGFQPEWIGPMLEQLPGRPHETTPVVALYHLGHRMLTQTDAPELAETFRERLAQTLPGLPREAAKGLLMLAINHQIRRINEGRREALRSVLDFYRLGLEQGLLHDERGALSRFTYNNVLMTFLALKEWDQAADFLAQYRAQLPASERENTYRYNLAVYRYRCADYTGTLDLLRDLRFSDPMYELESRKMLLKIFYEQNAFDALESLLDNLVTWLRRHGELGYHREMYRNLARYTARLLRLPPGDRAGREKLAQKIRDTPLVAERGWLLEKTGV